MEADERGRNGFLAVLSHDLRTPLVPILLAASSISSTLASHLPSLIDLIAAVRAEPACAGFKLFVQEGRSAGRSRGGLSVGLAALVKRLVELHGGGV